MADDVANPLVDANGNPIRYRLAPKLLGRIFEDTAMEVFYFFSLKMRHEEDFLHQRMRDAQDKILAMRQDITEAQHFITLADGAIFQLSSSKNHDAATLQKIKELEDLRLKNEQQIVDAEQNIKALKQQQVKDQDKLTTLWTGEKLKYYWLNRKLKSPPSGKNALIFAEGSDSAAKESQCLELLTDENIAHYLYYYYLDQANDEATQQVVFEESDPGTGPIHLAIAQDRAKGNKSIELQSVRECLKQSIWYLWNELLDLSTLGYVFIPRHQMKAMSRDKVQETAKPLAEFLGRDKPLPENASLTGFCDGVFLRKPSPIQDIVADLGPKGADYSNSDLPKIIITELKMRMAGNLPETVADIPPHYLYQLAKYASQYGRTQDDAKTMADCTADDKEVSLSHIDMSDIFIMMYIFTHDGGAIRHAFDGNTLQKAAQQYAKVVLKAPKQKKTSGGGRDWRDVAASLSPIIPLIVDKRTENTKGRSIGAASKHEIQDLKFPEPIIAALSHDRAS